MGKCLVTQLTESVNNDLPLFGKVIFKVNITSPIDGYLYLGVNGETTFELSDPTKRFYQSGAPNPSDTNKITIHANGSLYHQLRDIGEYDLIVSPNYNFITFDSHYYTFTNCNDLQNLFEYSSITSIFTSGRDGQFKGDISALKGKNMTQCTMPNQSDIKGDFDSVFGPMTNLIQFQIDGSKITGTIEGFVQQQVKAGRSNYAFEANKVGYLGAVKGLTFKGNPIPLKSNDYISWQINQSDNTKIDIDVNGITTTINKLNYIGANM